MRIIAGKWKGRTVHPNISKSPTRPTTDRVKESLFNRWHHEYDWEYTTALDLFSGTGLISLEFLSRGVPEVHSVDHHPSVLQNLNELRAQFEVTENWNIFALPVEEFLKIHTTPYALIFADPPYDWSQIRDLPDMIFEGPGLLPQGQLAIEHDKIIDFNTHSRYLEERKYGRTKISFFE